MALTHPRRAVAVLKGGDSIGLGWQGLAQSDAIQHRKESTMRVTHDTSAVVLAAVAIALLWAAVSVYETDAYRPLRESDHGYQDQVDLVDHKARLAMYGAGYVIEQAI